MAIESKKSNRKLKSVKVKGFQYQKNKKPTLVETKFFRIVSRINFFFFLPKKKFIQTERIQIKITKIKYKKYLKPLSKICRLSKNLYNLGNYHIRQEFIKKRYWIKYKELWNILKNTNDYKNLPSQTSQQVLMLLEKNWKSFFRAIKDWKKHPKKYSGRPKLPKYKKKDGQNIVIFTNQQCQIKKLKMCKNFHSYKEVDYLYFPKKVNIPPIKTRLNGKINHVRILPQGSVYIVEIVFEKIPIKLSINKKRILSIDLGLNNLVTMVNNAGLKAGIIKGGVVKSINQYYNKLNAKYRSIKDKQGLKGETNRLIRLRLKRNNRIIDIFHKISRKIINYCILGGFGRIIIGYNKRWKDKIKLGKRNNQNFVQIPYRKLVNMIEYKAKLVGIKVTTIEEWYTSKTSALDLEPITKHKNYLGKRIHRGLFQTQKGTLINADVNGALNILRKVIGDDFIKNQKDKKCWLHPKRWYVYENIKSNPKHLNGWGIRSRVRPDFMLKHISCKFDKF